MLARPLFNILNIFAEYRRLRSLLPAVLLALAIAATPIKSQAQNAAQANVTATEQQYLMNMREADVRAFVQWVADRTGKNIIIHRSVRGAVTVISNRPVNADEAYQLFLTVLKVNGFAAVETENAVKVIPEADSKTSALPFESAADSGASVVLSIIDIQHADASKLVTALRPLIPASGFIDAYVPTNAIIIADTSANLDKIRGLVRAFDKEGQTDVEIINIQHASASEIVDMLKNINMARQGSSESSRVNFLVDNRSNSVLMTGSLVARQQMRDLIRRLDIPLEGEGNTQVIYLNYIDAKEIVPILKSVGDSVLREKKAEDKNFSIESSETTNALVISAPPGLLNNLKAIISKLDIRRAQVLVEAVVVQVSAGRGDDIGVAWATGELRRDNPDGSVAAVSTLSATETAALSGLADGDGNGDLTLAEAFFSGSGLTYGYVKDGDLIAALRAVTSKQKSNIMSTPTVVALDNEEASLLVGRNLPFVTGSQTTAATPGSNPFQTIQREDIGVTLKITPRINQGDSITLQIEQTTENVIENDVNASDLITEKTEITTTALVRDGEVLVLGGLISNNQVKNRTQVPILGSIPVLGQLFRSDSLDNDRNNLMVFIRPTILKDELQVEGLTASRYAFMREKQLQAAMRAFVVESDPPLLEDFETFAPSRAANGEDTGNDSAADSL